MKSKQKLTRKRIEIRNFKISNMNEETAETRNFKIANVKNQEIQVQKKQGISS